ncbi:uncharacterized protein At3g43530 [Arabidopsis lyrata subsp. lyrata]|uniref:uncharacterized protein At3g43530 n=1 Tax=Arabidopsis lyrata subsp. lyrata TaxID=81972 RepID=UPI000A29B768|nr:uncharacterized protein At3g43530 [Arabidopsis lyrata subsp. lyrata]|eukprot:XP_002883754.2 uncharacterized protein At3g43530 [Arabidopsis lyrata subsp. lyrata]
MLLLRTACLDKKKECWFIVNGVPIRYSIQEFALISGLFCHSYPKNYEAIGSDRFSGKHFGTTGTVTYARVKEKLLSMKRSNPDRLKMAVLYLLCSVIVEKRKTGPQAEPVEDLFLTAVEDLEWCKTFPWGRFAFEHNMKDIFHLLDHFDGGLGAQWVFPSFVMPLEILAFEAIPNLMNQFREHVVSADPECPRMCKMKFKPSSMKDFPMSELYDSLGTTKEIESIMLPNPSENELLRRIMDNEDGSDDFDDVIVNGWTRRIFKVHKQVCFEELHNIDVGNRVMEESQENAVVAGVRVSGRKVAPEKVSKKGLVEKLQKQLEDGFRRINKKFDGFDKRLKCVELDVKSLKEGRGKANELDKRGEEKDYELEEDEIEESGGEDKENASELEEDENGEDGEKDKEFEENDNGEDGDKELEGKELEENENGDNGEKEKEGDLEGNDLDGDNEKEGDLERNNLDGDKEKEKEKSSEKRQQMKKTYERKRTRKTSAKEQEEEVQVGKKAKVTKKKDLLCGCLGIFKYVG